MKISYNWLKQFIKTEGQPKQTATLLTNLGLEVEGIETFCSIKGGLEGVVVGEVLDCWPHPDADRLKLTKVTIGEQEPLQIVCGAPNVAIGQKVAVATIGTKLYTKEGAVWEIKKGKIRGEESFGMLCAEDELGLGNSHEGIMVLDPNVKVGTPLAKVFEIENDVVFEIGLTPNRADAMSHWGVARDLRAGLVLNHKVPELITPSTSNFHIDNRNLKIDVEVLDATLAPRYCGITINGVTVKQSPKWLQNRLKAIGLTPINNVVDCTNYVLHELGQPLHAFDAHEISGNKIIVKTLPSGTKFTTLDGVKRTLHEEDLMICDEDKPLCIAGVFGGLESGVTKQTKKVFLESAYFNPISIRKTAKRHGLFTDASFRFERGIDPNITEYALKRAAMLIIEVAGGETACDLIDVYPKKIEDHQVVLNFENAKKIIGEEIPKETIKKILAALDIKINNVTETGLGITIPAYRNDVTREIDVIEEILRVYGYNNIKISTKLNASISITQPIEDYKIRQKVSAQLTALGFHEMMNNSLTNPKYYELIDDFKENHFIKIVNPLSTELEVLRQTLLFGALETAAYNKNRKNNNIKLFEFGKTYHHYLSGREEKKHLILMLTGGKTEFNWTTPQQNSNFFYLKGIVKSMLEKLGITHYEEKNNTTKFLSEGQSFHTPNKQLVQFGVIQKNITQHFDIDAEVLYADFNWDDILINLSVTNKKIVPISKFPKVKRDLALLLNQDVAFIDLEKTAFATENKYLKEVSLFDVYTGKNLPEGKKSYALSFTLLDPEKTLTDKQIDKIMKNLQVSFEKNHGASLR